MKRDSFLLCCRNMLIRELAAVWVAVLLCHLQLTGSQVSGRLLFRYGFFRWHRGRHCFATLRFLLPFFFSIENLPIFAILSRIHHFSPRNKIFRWNSNSWKFTNWSVKLWWQFYTNFSRIIPFLLNEVNRQTDLIKNEQKLENSIRYKNRLRLELLIDGKWWSRCRRRRGVSRLGFSSRNWAKDYEVIDWGPRESPPVAWPFARDVECVACVRGESEFQPACRQAYTRVPYSTRNQSYQPLQYFSLYRKCQREWSFS